MHPRVSPVVGRPRVRWLGVLAVATALAAPSPAGAVAMRQTTIGPPSATPTPSHIEYDRNKNTVTVDETGASTEASVPGILTDVRYFAGPDGQAGGGSLAFLAVNPGTERYDWVGDQIADSTTSSSGLTYVPNQQNTYTPTQTVAIPQGDALGVYQSSQGIIPLDSTGTDSIVQQFVPAGAPPATGDQFTRNYGPNNRNYAFQGDFDPATQLVVSPAAGNTGTAPAGSLDQLPYVVSFQVANGTVVPDTVDAPNIALSSSGGTVTDCHGNPVSNPSSSATPGVYSFCLQVDDTVGTDTITAGDPGAGSVAHGGATVTQTNPVPSQVSVTIGTASLPADGSSQTTVTAHLTDASGDSFPGRTVTFSSSPTGGPTFSPAATTTTSTNQAVTTLTTSGTAGTYTVTASDAAAGVSGSTQLTQTSLPAPPPTSTPTPAPTGTTPPATNPVVTPPPHTTPRSKSPTTVSYSYLVARHRSVTASAKLTGCRKTYAGRGGKRHATGIACRLALTIKGLKTPRGSRARLTRGGAAVGTGTTTGATVTLTVVSARIKSGRYTLALSGRHVTEKLALQVHVS